VKGRAGRGRWRAVVTECSAGNTVALRTRGKVMAQHRKFAAALALFHNRETAFRMVARFEEHVRGDKPEVLTRLLYQILNLTLRLPVSIP
jgi:hypothetical protein